jgi:hypothetical protein
LRLTKDEGWQAELKDRHETALRRYREFKRRPSDENAIAYLRAARAIDEHFRATGLQLL